MKSVLKISAVLILLILSWQKSAADDAVAPATVDAVIYGQPRIDIPTLPSVADAVIEMSFSEVLPPLSKGIVPNIYEMPYSMTADYPQWNRLWVNTAVLTGAFVGSLVVLNTLPDDATSWNRAALQKTPPFKRWYKHVIKEGPEFDSDNPVFNFVLHPYAGAAYFMAARSCGFNFWRSFLYCSLISNVAWEFGIEAFMERPSYQDLVITPLVGSIIGELFYKAKREIVGNDYTLCGSRVFGNVVVFFIDPVNEVINLFRGSDTRRLHLGRRTPTVSSAFVPQVGKGSFGFTLMCTF